MTRKDYELIARAFRDAAEDHERAGRYAEAIGVLDAATVLSRRLCATNPRFDRGRFLTACGLENN
jgi:hypothetical protein